MREEISHYTPEQVRNHVIDALQIVDSLKIEGSDREVLLPAILTLLSNKNVMVTPTAAIGGVGRGGLLRRPQ